MKKNRFILLAIAMVFLAGCAGVPVKDIQVSAEADAKANFKGYKTYTWLGSAAILHDTVGLWEPPNFDADTEVKFIIDRELRKRGMSETMTNPDLLVAFAMGVDMDALGLKKNPESDMHILANVPKGGLVIALIDEETGVLIWLGLAEAEVQDSPSNETVKARLDYAVTQMLKKIPK